MDDLAMSEVCLKGIDYEFEAAIANKAAER